MSILRVIEVRQMLQRCNILAGEGGRFPLNPCGKFATRFFVLLSVTQVAKILKTKRRNAPNDRFLELD